MKVIDVHVHLSGKIAKSDVEAFMDRTKIDGLHLLSRFPSDPKKARQFVGELAELHAKLPEAIVPLVWVNPLAKNAAKDAEWAVREAGMRGIKMIPNGWYPEDPRAREIYALAQELGVFIQFHSGILWSSNDSSRYCRPAGFETMWDFPKVRFSLAHIGWPWCDECIAVVQKFNVKRPKEDQAFADLTPGTPPIYRPDAMAKCLAVVGADHMIFGSDSALPKGTVPTGMWQKDNQLLKKLGASKKERAKIFGGNAERFVAKRGK